MGLLLFEDKTIVSDSTGLEIVNRVNQKYPHLLQTNTNRTCFDFITYVLADLNQIDVGWGYLGKTNGEGQYRPPTWTPKPMTSWDGKEYVVTGFSHDAIFNRDAHQQIDCIGRGNDGSEPLGQPGIPQWGKINPQFYRPNNPWVDPKSVSGSQPVPPAQEVPTYEEIGGDTFFRANVGVPLEADMTLAGQTLNNGSSVWFSRTCYDLIVAHINGNPTQADIDAIVKKHRNEWRSILGLPPL